MEDAVGATAVFDLPAINDPVYRAKLVDLPDIIATWVLPYAQIAGAEVLDFGCGEATTALGTALRKGAARVVGIDIVADPDLCAPLARRHLGIERLPPNLELHRVNVGSLHDPSDRFDLVYSWSVMEHVREDVVNTTLAMLRRALRPGGLLFVQIAPLYYSSEGSHLFHKVPERWGHLLHQHSEYMRLLAEASPDRSEFEGLVSTYETLNRITAPRLLDAIRAAGFEVLREYYTRDDHPIPPPVAEAYREEVLRTAQFVVLSQAPAGA